MMEQRSPEWFATRLGRVTASRVADVMATTKSGPGASRRSYMAELVAERLTGRATERFTNAAMQHGTDQEPQARAAYEFQRDVTVVEVGFIPHPTIPMFGASPDGLVGDDGLIEIKAPQTATHLDTLLGAPIARGYMIQMHVQMMCCEREWCDFASFDPRFPAEMQLHVRRVDRNEELVREIEEAVTAFLAELAWKVTMLSNLYGVAPVVAPGIAMPPGFGFV